MTEKRKKRGDRESKNIEACSLFFGDNGKEKVKTRLRDAVRDARKEAGMDEAQLDEICFFKEDKLPTCAEFEENPALMTHLVFCRAASALGLKIDEVLNIDCSGKRLETIVKAMDSSNTGLVAALPIGGTKREPISNEKIAPVFAAFKILSEI